MQTITCNIEGFGLALVCSLGDAPNLIRRKFSLTKIKNVMQLALFPFFLFEFNDKPFIPVTLLWLIKQVNKREQAENKKLIQKTNNRNTSAMNPIKENLPNYISNLIPASHLSLHSFRSSTKIFKTHPCILVLMLGPRTTPTTNPNV